MAHQARTKSFEVSPVWLVHEQLSLLLYTLTSSRIIMLMMCSLTAVGNSLQRRWPTKRYTKKGNGAKLCYGRMPGWMIPLWKLLDELKNLVGTMSFPEEPCGMRHQNNGNNWKRLLMGWNWMKMKREFAGQLVTRIGSVSNNCAYRFMWKLKIPQGRNLLVVVA